MQGIEWSGAELTLVLVAAIAILAALAVTIWGIVRAAQRRDTIWVIGMVAGLFLGGWGWIVAVLYLVTVGRERS